MHVKACACYIAIYHYPHACDICYISGIDWEGPVSLAIDGEETVTVEELTQMLTETQNVRSTGFKFILIFNLICSGSINIVLLGHDKCSSS